MKEANTGKGALFIIGAVYVVLGGIFVVLGLIFFFAVSDADAVFVGIPFSLIGSVFLILGIVFLVREQRKKRIASELLARGQYITGEVVDFERNYNIRVNNRCPFVIMARYVDVNGTAHIFRSRNLFHYPDKSILGMQVKIYIEDDTFRHYYMDIDEILPTVVEH